MDLLNGTVDFDESTHTYQVDGKTIPSVTEILGYVKADSYRKINPSVLDYAASRGKAVHEATEFIDYGEPPEVYPEIAPYVEAYIRFKRDYECEWFGIEQILYRPGAVGYCGTVDRYGTVDGEWAVLDIKTMASPTKEDYICLCAQTAAYDEAIPDKPPLKHYGLFLRKDGTYRLVDCADYEKKFGISGWDIFMKCYKLYSFLKEIKNNGKRTDD